MRFTSLKKFGCAAVAALALAAPHAYADDEEAEATPDIDAELKAEIDYVEALVYCGFPDFAAPVIEATKKKWPESEAMFFAIEIRGLLSMNRFDEAEAKIAALPDRNGSKYWAARLEVANNFFARGKKKECSAIYDEFFTKFANPPKELREFYMQACYAWGQILMGDKRFEEAAKVYEGLLGQIKVKDDDTANTWCNVACETAEMYLHLADGVAEVSARGKFLGPAKKLIDKLLWEQSRPVYFGRAIAMKAHLELLKGRVDKAQAVIDDYMDQLAELHKSIVEFDPDGRKGLLRQSPMPQCRFLLADMLWKEAKAEAAKPKKDDERIKSLMFGEKTKTGKRNNAGAYNHALNVFINYPESSWAAQAGELSEDVRAFAVETYGAKIKTNITPEQMRKVREMQFKNANEKLSEGDYEGAIADYYVALSHYPEGAESVGAIEKVVDAYLNRILRSGDAEKNEEYRIDADAIEGYLCERFAGHRDREVMTAAGDAVLRIAAAEKQHKELARADRLYKDFILNFRRHVNAPLTATALAAEAAKEERWADALAFYQIIGKYYQDAKEFYGPALAQSSACCEKLGDRDGAIANIKAYCEFETSPLKKTQGQMQLAVLYQKNGLDILSNAETNATPEAVEADEKRGTAQIVRGIQQFLDFAKRAEEKMADPGVSKGEKAQYSVLREGALFMVGDCWGRLTKPEAKLDDFRRRAVESLELYVKAYPEGKYAKAAYVKLGAYYTALGDVEASKDALARLQKLFPDSTEAKNAKPRLAKALIEMGKKKEGTEIYAEMLRLDGAYTAGQFVNAGEALIEAKSWDLANQAFEKAIAKAGTNQWTTVARARIGQAKSLYKQKSYAEAREALDEFIEDKRMSRMAIAADANLLLVEVATEQARTEKDDTLRKRHSGAAIKAVKNLRRYWSKRPVHEQDRIDLMSAEVTINRMKAEEAMGLTEQAHESCARAAGALQSFYQSKGPSEAHPIDKFTAGELGNIERCLREMVPLYARLGEDRAEFVLRYGTDYMKFFPNGKARTEIQNCINQAIAAGAKLGAGTAVEAAPVEPDGDEAEAEGGAEAPVEEVEAPVEDGAESEGGEEAAAGDEASEGGEEAEGENESEEEKTSNE